jgi:hypothetical protein
MLQSVPVYGMATIFSRFKSYRESLSAYSMKAKVYELHPELERAPDTEDTLQSLIQAAIETWHAIDERGFIEIYVIQCLIVCRQSSKQMVGTQVTKVSIANHGRRAILMANERVP